MAHKKTRVLTKTDIKRILSLYRLQKNEFRCIEGLQELTYESIRLKGYVISFSEELLCGERTGRIIVTHTRCDGKINLYDIWERDADGQLQFRFRNPQGTPPADIDYIKGLEEENRQLREVGQISQEKIRASDNADLNGQMTGSTNESHKLNSEDMIALQEARAEMQELKKELDMSHKLISDLKDELARIKNAAEKNTGHNARGAGRKPSKERADAVERCRLLLGQGKSREEIQDILGISSATFYRYKRFINV